MTKDVFAQLTLNNNSAYHVARTNMLKQQIRTWDVLDDKILTLFYKVPREEFVPEAYRPLAFADTSIPLARGQSMMTPKEEARILQELQVREGDKILVLGADSGFLLVLLSLLGQCVFYLNDYLSENEKVQYHLAKFGIKNVTCLVGNLNQGWQDFAPFDVIILTGSLAVIPEFLKKALSIGGRILAITGKPPIMEAMIIKRISENTWSEKKIFETERPRLSGMLDADAFVF